MPDSTDPCSSPGDQVVESVEDGNQQEERVALDLQIAAEAGPSHEPDQGAQGPDVEVLGTEGPDGMRQGEEAAEAAEGPSITRLTTWLKEGEEAGMMHDLVTCVASIVAGSEEGKGELVIACFRAYQAAEWAQQKGHYKELTVDQAASLAMYTYEFMGDDVYRRMNRVIKEVCEGSPLGVQHKRWKPFIRLFTSAVVVGAELLRDIQLYRGQPLNSIDTAGAGPYLPYRYMSTSRKKHAALRFPPPTEGAAELLNVALEGEAAVYGIRLSPVSSYREDEVLLLPNQQFKVRNVTAVQGSGTQTQLMGATKTAGTLNSSTRSFSADSRPVTVERHLREVHLSPLRNAQEALEELFIGQGTDLVGVSVLVKPKLLRLTDKKQLVFKMPSGLSEQGSDHLTMTYTGEDAEGLKDGRVYRLGSLARDESNQTEVAELLDPRSDRPMQLPDALPPGACFSYVASFPVSSEQHRQMFKRAGQAWCGFKFGGVRIVETMHWPLFCLWYAQVDILSALLICVLLAVGNHSAVTYPFPFLDICLQCLCSLRLYWLNRGRQILYLDQVLLVRLPFYLLRLACGTTSLCIYMNFDSRKDDPVPLLFIITLKVFMPFSMLLTSFFCLGDHAEVFDRVTMPHKAGQAAVGARQQRFRCRYGGSLFVLYDACLHGYMAHLAHALGALVVSVALVCGALADVLRLFYVAARCCCWLRRSCARSDRSEGVEDVVGGLCPPRLLSYPARAMVEMSFAAADCACAATMLAWEEAGGETMCLVELGRWQHRRFQHLASAAYWRWLAAQHKQRRQMRQQREREKQTPEVMV